MSVSVNSLLIYNGVTPLSCAFVIYLLNVLCYLCLLFRLFLFLLFFFFLFFLSHCSAVLGSMNSAIEVKDTPSEDLSLDEDYLGKFLFVLVVLISLLLLLS